MLMRAYGISPDETPSDNFADAGNSFYTNYLSAAKRLGITNGIGNNMYLPDEAVSRQDMFTLLYRTLVVLNEVPESGSGKTLADFSDASKIGSLRRKR